MCRFSTRSSTSASLFDLFWTNYGLALKLKKILGAHRHLCTGRDTEATNNVSCDPGVLPFSRLIKAALGILKTRKKLNVCTLRHWMII